MIHKFIAGKAVVFDYIDKRITNMSMLGIANSSNQYFVELMQLKEHHMGEIERLLQMAQADPTLW